MAIVKKKVDPDNTCSEKDIEARVTEWFLRECTAYTDVWKQAEKAINIVIESPTVTLELERDELQDKE